MNRGSIYGIKVMLNNGIVYNGGSNPIVYRFIIGLNIVNIRKVINRLLTMSIIYDTKYIVKNKFIYKFYEEKEYASLLFHRELALC
mgnify:CR=1 FL=1